MTHRKSHKSSALSIQPYTPPTATLVEVTVERGFAVSLPDDVVNPW